MGRGRALVEHVGDRLGGLCVEGLAQLVEKLRDVIGERRRVEVRGGRQLAHLFTPAVEQRLSVILDQRRELVHHVHGGARLATLYPTGRRGKLTSC